MPMPMPMWWKAAGDPRGEFAVGVNHAVAEPGVVVGRASLVHSRCACGPRGQLFGTRILGTTLGGATVRDQLGSSITRG